MFENSSGRQVLQWAAIAWSLVLLFCTPQKACAAAQEAISRFTTPVALPQHRSEYIDYTIDPLTSNFLVYLPSNYTQGQSFGVIVFISALDIMDGLPPGWAEVLERRKLLLIGPQNAGNAHPQSIRCGLAVIGALEMLRNYNVDKTRVYAAGLSGGARTACDLAFTQSDLFCGTIQCCGTDFYRDVQKRYATSDVDTNGYHYGVCQASASEVAEARNRPKFVLITGSNDFRRGNILDIYNGGFALERFRAKLIDVPDMGHQTCDGKTLEEALDFLR